MPTSRLGQSALPVSRETKRCGRASRWNEDVPGAVVGLTALLARWCRTRDCVVVEVSIKLCPLHNRSAKFSRCCTPSLQAPHRQVEPTRPTATVGMARKLRQAHCGHHVDAATSTAQGLQETTMVFRIRDTTGAPFPSNGNPSPF